MFLGLVATWAMLRSNERSKLIGHNYDAGYNCITLRILRTQL